MHSDNELSKEEWHRAKGLYEDCENDASDVVVNYVLLERELAAAQARIAELERELRIAECKNRGTLANNLCPDHRDKQVGKPCLACAVERLERERDALTRRLKAMLPLFIDLTLGDRMDAVGNPDRWKAIDAVREG